MKSILEPIRGTSSVDGVSSLNPHTSSFLPLTHFGLLYTHPLLTSSSNRLHWQYSFLRRFHLLHLLLRQCLSLFLPKTSSPMTAATRKCRAKMVHTISRSKTRALRLSLRGRPVTAFTVSPIPNWALATSWMTVSHLAKRCTTDKHLALCTALSRQPLDSLM